MKTRKTRKVKKRKTRNSRIRQKTFRKKDYNSGDGMLTYVWGPPLWHSLHTISFNYPVKPTREQKKQYRDWILGLQYVLPCRYCRINLKKNFSELPLTMSRMKNRETFSRYIYELHEKVNQMLGKKSGLSYNDVRERYEHFRARCVAGEEKPKHIENGCTNPLYGKKSKCVMSIIPLEQECETFTIDKACERTR